MKHYIEITLLPNEEVGLYFLWSKVYQQIHLALVEHQKRDGSFSVGCGFPGYRSQGITLGDKLRLFNDSEQVLNDLNLSEWFKQLADYIHITSIKNTPENTKGHAVFSRQVIKGSPEKRAKRYAKRHNISEEEAQKIYEKVNTESTTAPYIKLTSQTNGQPFPLVIARLSVAKPVTNSETFNAYGLSNAKSVPWF